MQIEEFNKLREALLIDSKKLLDEKNIHYRGGANIFDVLNGFDELGKLGNIKREEVCMVMLNKHLLSIRHYFSGNESMDGVKQNFIDAINYMLFLYAMSIEVKRHKKCCCAEKNIKR